MENSSTTIVVCLIAYTVLQQYHIHKLINKIMSRSYWEYEKADQMPKHIKVKLPKDNGQDRLQNEDMSILNDVRIF